MVALNIRKYTVLHLTVLRTFKHFRGFRYDRTDAVGSVLGYSVEDDWRKEFSNFLSLIHKCIYPSSHEEEINIFLVVHHHEKGAFCMTKEGDNPGDFPMIAYVPQKRKR